MHRRQASTNGRDPSAPLATGDNRLLAQLPPATLTRISAHFHAVDLERGHVLFRGHEPLAAAYFPTTAIVSLVARLESGEMLDVGLVGREGLAGTAVLPGVTRMLCEGTVQIAGSALQIGADILAAAALEDVALASAIGRYTQFQQFRSMQMSACNMFHTVDQRCIRWLLMVDDLLPNADIPLTHEMIGTMMGVHRPTVSLVLGSLLRARAIEETRGRIVILDRRFLEDACCECYGAMADEQRRLFRA